MAGLPGQWDMFSGEETPSPTSSTPSDTSSSPVSAGTTPSDTSSDSLSPDTGLRIILYNRRGAAIDWRRTDYLPSHAIGPEIIFVGQRRAFIRWDLHPDISRHAKLADEAARKFREEQVVAYVEATHHWLPYFSE